MIPNKKKQKKKYMKLTTSWNLKEKKGNGISISKRKKNTKNNKKNLTFHHFE